MALHDTECEKESEREHPSGESSRDLQSQKRDKTIELIFDYTNEHHFSGLHLFSTPEGSNFDPCKLSPAQFQRTREESYQEQSATLLLFIPIKCGDGVRGGGRNFCGHGTRNA